MYRYLVEISYLGTHYVGWQIQPNGLSVQEAIQQRLLTLLQKETIITGCGRTDAGVHASQYFFHFDTDDELDRKFWESLRKILPRDIAYLGHRKVSQNMSARYDATSRAYQYRIHTRKNPFLQGLSLSLRAPHQYNQKLMSEAAGLLLDYEDFSTFCKTGDSARHHRCLLWESEWNFEEDSWTYTVRANRFLRGMVRLIVGMCLYVGNGQMSTDAVSTALRQKEKLPKPYSVPAHGLYLTEVSYNPERKG